MSRPPDPERRRGGRRIVKGLAWLAFVVLLLEGGAAALLAGWKRAPPWPSISARELEALALAPAREAVVPARRPGTFGRERLHPYVGFLPGEQATKREGLDLARLNDPLLFAPESPLFRPDPARLVVAVAGGSVAGQLLQYGRSALSEGLAAVPRFAGREPWFVGLAFGGWKQPQQLMAVTQLLAMGARFDLVIDLDGFNEVTLHAAENAPAGVAPVYPRTWYLRTAEDLDLVPRMGEILYLQRRRRALAQATLDSPLFPSFGYRLLWAARDRAIARDLGTSNLELRAAQAPQDVVALGPRRFPEEQSTAELALIWRLASEQLAHLAAANGFEYLHALQPNQYVAGSKPFSPEEVAQYLDPSHIYGRYAAAGYEALQAEVPSLVESGVRFADLTLVFADVEETVYADDCCHFNERGYELIARALARALE